jgi:hypothetical protein
MVKLVPAGLVKTLVSLLPIPSIFKLSSVILHTASQSVNMVNSENLLRIYPLNLWFLLLPVGAHIINFALQILQVAFSALLVFQRSA